MTLDDRLAALLRTAPPELPAVPVELVARKVRAHRTRLAAAGVAAALAVIAAVAVPVALGRGSSPEPPVQQPPAPEVTARPITVPPILAVVDGRAGIYSAAGTLTKKIDLTGVTAVATDPTGGWVVAAGRAADACGQNGHADVKLVAADGTVSDPGAPMEIAGRVTGLAMNPAGRIAVAASAGCPAAARLAVLDAAGTVSPKQWDLAPQDGNEIIGLSWATDGIRLGYSVAMNTGGGGLGGSPRLVDTTTASGPLPGTGWNVLPTGCTPDGVGAWLPGGGTAELYTCDSSGITLDTGSTGLLHLPAPGSANGRLSVSGNRILAVTSAGIWLAAGSTLTQVQVHGDPTAAAFAGVPTVTRTPASTGPAKLAYLQGDRLMVVENGTSREFPLPDKAIASQPVWSHDGSLLSLVVASPDQGKADENVRIYRADGGLVTTVTGAAGRPVWSPTADELAVPEPNTDRVALVGAGSDGEAVADGAPGSVAWSPDGSELAIAATKGDRSTIETVPAAGGAPTTRVSLTGSGLEVAGWRSDGTGLVYRVDPDFSASLAADGEPVYSLTLGGKPVQVGTSLDVPGWTTGDGVVVDGTGRTVWAAGRTVKLCGENGGSCASPPSFEGSTGRVSLDPALNPLLSLSPQLAFVEAPSRPDGATFDQASLRSWYAQRRLAVWGYTGGNDFVQAAAGTGVAAPSWSADGRTLRYVADNALWQWNYPSGTPTKVAGPIFTGDWPNDYGQVDWQDRFAWSG